MSVTYYDYELFIALDNFSKTIVAFLSDRHWIKLYMPSLKFAVKSSIFAKTVYNFIHRDKYVNFKCGVCLRPYMLSQLFYNVTHTEMSWTLWRVKSRLFI